MKNIEDIIDYVKNNAEDANLVESIEIKFKFEIDNGILKQESLPFLIDLTTDNVTLDTSILRDIFLQSLNKIEQKVIMSTEIRPSAIFDINAKDDTALSLLTIFGHVFIKPKTIVLLWNNFKNPYNSEYDGIDVKLINYRVLIESSEIFVDEGLVANVTKNYKRNHGFERENGFNAYFNLLIQTENEKSIVRINDSFKGSCLVLLNGTRYKFELNQSEDIYDLMSRSRETLVTLFRKQKDKFWSYAKQFVSNKKLFPFQDLFYDSVKGEKELYPIPKIENMIFLEEKVNTYNLLAKLRKQEICEHVKVYKDVYKSQQYFEKINDFINNYISYSDGRAICKLCSETIKELNIQGTFFHDGIKFVTTNDNILTYPPYNKFENLKYFMENIFYNYTLLTKVGVFNSMMITRIFIDNLILVSSKRLELETVYRNDITEGNIFLLRLTNNFFEAMDLEKEKFKQQRMFFTNLPIYIIVLATSSINTFYDLFFLKKKIKLHNIRPDISQITFEDALVSIIDLVFKGVLEVHKETDVKLRQKKLRRSIRIYYEIFNDEFRTFYNDKKILFEAFIKRASEHNNLFQFVEIGNFMNDPIFKEFDTNGHYLLYDKKISMSKTKQLLQYYNTRKYELTDVNGKLIESKPKVEEREFIDLFEISEAKATKKELNDLDTVCSEFENEQFYKYNNEKVEVLVFDDESCIVYSAKQRLLLHYDECFNILSLNKYSNPLLVEGDDYLFLKEPTTDQYDTIIRSFLKILLGDRKYYSNANSFVKTIKSRRDCFLLKLKLISRYYVNTFSDTT